MAKKHRSAPAPRPRGPRLLQRPGVWLSLHLQTVLDTLGRLRASPLPSAMTVAVIGISLALPAALYILSENLRSMAGSWDQTAAISLFLELRIDDAQATTLAQQLEAWEEIDRIQLITRDQALAEFRDLGGFEDALDKITKNPLPNVLAVYPHPEHADPERLTLLQERLLDLPEADFARMDTLWLQRLQAILDLVQVVALLLGGLLSIGVLLTVGNTIRLEILNRRIEIEIMELVGATANFIRRPFLYTGAWYGLLGGMTAWLLVALATLLLQGPVSRLASLYHSEFRLAGLGVGDTGLMLSSGIVLGLVGSWLAVSQHLRGARPF
ncbi:cell division transport system permease protein [Allochromatium warmingii]|uniref:Cell division protein FtsX n=1 Tax=Allochromatium warmingii TaxID=61595 RepID=A0A1H3AR76_ALLWA|nr:permease-like cell division protein FtsX [Allochromatium warmingii]SDX32240.1 cell division transport system permease protein [Allochromatium warmingii]